MLQGLSVTVYIFIDGPHFIILALQHLLLSYKKQSTGEVDVNVLSFSLIPIRCWTSGPFDL